MTIMSVDLAHTSCDNLGNVVLDAAGDRVATRALAAGDLDLTGSPSPVELAARLAHVCKHLSVTTLLLDGPQAWKHPENGLKHSRVCERKLNTPGKTGLPGCAKPGGYLAFIAFSVAVFQEFVAQGFELWSGQPSSRLALETFPSSAWRQLNLPPLPAKSRTRVEHLRRAAS